MSTVIRSTFHELCSLPQCLWESSQDESVVINVLSGLAVVHGEVDGTSIVHLASCHGWEAGQSSVRKVRELDAQHLLKLLSVWRAQARAMALPLNML